MNTNYNRVLPRDLFNESKLLKCMGRLCLLIHDGLVPVNMKIIHDGDPFQVSLMPEGCLTISNISIEVKGQEIMFKTTYNGKSNYPLYVEHEYVDYPVFNESGEFTKDFIELCKNLD